MKLAALFDLFDEARKLIGHQDFVVIGSLSILGLEGDFNIPDGMTLSIDVDCYTKNDPELILDVLGALGENSPYHHQSGFYLDAVNPALPSLPDGWADRLIKIERGDLRAWFLDPNDAALSKYARGEPRDQRWIRAGVLAGVVSLPLVSARFRSTHFLDAAEALKAKTLVDADRVWFDAVQRKRAPPSPRKKG